MDKRVLLSMSREELLRQGFIVVCPSECSQFVADNLVAFDAQAERVLIVYVTTPLQALDLWLDLLGNDGFHEIISEPKSSSVMSFHVHTWSESLDGGYSCTTSELTANDFNLFFQTMSGFLRENSCR